MNKIILTLIVSVVVLGSCSKDDDEHDSGNNEKLIIPEMERMATSPSTSFTGALMVLPCLEDTSIYYGNFNQKEVLSSIYAQYTIGNGSIFRSILPVKLPLGNYNFLYWGVPQNSETDPTYSDVAVNDPGIRIGADLAELNYSLRKQSNADTTYSPVYDFVYARQTIQVGTDKMQATLVRVVAGIKVVITNRGGAKIDPSIASARVLVGSIADQLNYYTAVPSDFTKTVAFSLGISADSLSLSANSTVLTFPSGDSPLLTILLTLKNGQVKKFMKPLTNPLTAGNRLTLNITLGDLFSEEGSADGFEVENWTESTETINFPAG